MRNIKSILPIFLVVFVTGCAAPGPSLTPIQIQSLQTREFESEKEVVFASVLSVFQDLGYILKTADKDTGFITADSPTKNDTGFWAAYAGLSTTSQTAATAFIEQIGSMTRVRINIVSRKASSSSLGQNTANDTPILDAEIYQNAFEKIENAIFIRSS